MTCPEDAPPTPPPCGSVERSSPWERLSASTRHHRPAWRLREALPTMGTMQSASMLRSVIDRTTPTMPSRSAAEGSRCSTT